MFVHDGIERETVSPAGGKVMDVDIGISAEKSLIIIPVQQN